MNIVESSYYLGQLAPLAPFRFFWDAALCDLCGKGGRSKWGTEDRGIIGHNWRLVCYPACPSQPRPERRSHQAWWQAGHWRYSDGRYNPFFDGRELEEREPSDTFIHQIDAARCDFCGVPTGILFEAVHWLTACDRCNPGDVFGRMKMHREPEPVELPEFPIYVGWDGQEHGEF